MADPIRWAPQVSSRRTNGRMFLGMSDEALEARYLNFDFLFYPDGGQVVAHCLQTDTAAFGPDIGAAKKALQELLAHEIGTALEDGDLGRVFASPAPESVWQRVEQVVRMQYRAWPVKLRKRTYNARVKDIALAGAEA